MSEEPRIIRRMSTNTVELGARYGPFPGTLDADTIRAYAAATNDPNPQCRDGRAVPPTFPVLLIFEAQNAANAAIPRAVIAEARAAVHGEHDIVLHRALVPGEHLDTWSALRGLRATSTGTRVVMYMEQLDRDGRVAVEHWWTLFLAGVTVGSDGGDEPPEHTFPDPARVRPVATTVTHVDADQAQRYGAVSDDWSAHHFDPAVAQATGFPEVFLHGLCTMAMCANRGVEVLAGGDPARVRRVAVRFSSPTFLDRDLSTAFYEIEPSSFAFEAECGGATVVKHGRLELDSATHSMSRP
jgi:acyl dehydratase